MKEKRNSAILWIPCAATAPGFHSKQGEQHGRRQHGDNFQKEINRVLVMTLPTFGS